METNNTTGKKGKNPNSPSEIRKRIRSLKRKVAKEERVKRLLREEQYLRDRIKGGW